MGKTFDPERYNGLLSTESYVREINQVPLLTPEEESRLAARYRKCNDREAAEQLDDLARLLPQEEMVQGETLREMLGKTKPPAETLPVPEVS